MQNMDVHLDPAAALSPCWGRWSGRLFGLNLLPRAVTTGGVGCNGGVTSHRNAQ